jgi:hypothetical protein
MADRRHLILRPQGDSLSDPRWALVCRCAFCAMRLADFVNAPRPWYCILASSCTNLSDRGRHV